jgi:predicted HD superfamily hydrolase involved in NAD metabolism
MTYCELARRVRAHIGQAHRYAHVVRVARLAETLARIHGESTRRARLAGMLHDLARLYSAAQLIEECKRLAIPRDAFAVEHPIVLHAPLGAELAREQFGITDQAVLSAIAKHTLADGVMSRLDAVVYLADALEPGRDDPQREKFLALAALDLDAAMRATLAANREHLLSQGRAVAPQTVAAIAFYDARSRNGQDASDVCSRKAFA